MIENYKLKISDQQTKKHAQIDMQWKFLTHDLEWMDIIPKDRDNVNFNEEAKSKYIWEKLNQADNNEKEWMDSLPQNAGDLVPPQFIVKMMS